MHSSQLYPPNIESMSDGVIGVLAVRKTKRSSCSQEKPCLFSYHQPRTTELLSPRLVPRSVASSDTVPVYYPTQKTTTNSIPSAVINPTRQQNLVSTTSQGNNNSRGGSFEIISVLHGMNRQERRRTTQQIYRKKLRNNAHALEENVIRLRDEVQQLKYKKLIVYSAPAESTSWSVVSEYFRLFRHGTKARTEVTESLSLTRVHAQKIFLQRAMDPEVAFNGGYGVDAVFDDWRLISLHHEEMEIQLM